MECAVAAVGDVAEFQLTVSRFVYGSQSHSPDYVVQGGVTYAYVRNHLGSIRLVVNSASGAVAQRLDYDSWGNVTGDTGPDFQSFGFAGGVYDGDTRLTSASVTTTPQRACGPLKTRFDFELEVATSLLSRTCSGLATWRRWHNRACLCRRTRTRTTIRSRTATRPGSIR